MAFGDPTGTRRAIRALMNSNGRAARNFIYCCLSTIVGGSMHVLGAAGIAGLLAQSMPAVARVKVSSLIRTRLSIYLATSDSRWQPDYLMIQAVAADVSIQLAQQI
jgi:hypothetical protein